jgi:DNA-binding LacI/PurR family transcriptional regulator
VAGSRPVKRPVRGREVAPGLPPTLADIGVVTGVSASTVSRVLNGAPSTVPIAPATRKRVLEAARQLGYRPNPHARSLRGAPTMLLGAIVRDFSDPFFGGAIEILAAEARGHGYNIVLGHALGQTDEGVALPSVLETRQTDGILLMGDMQDQPTLLADLRSSSVPVVAMWQGSSPIEFPTTDVDEKAGIVVGLDYLASLGHARIAFVSARLPGANTHREDAYGEFMRARFGGVADGYLRRVDNTLAGGEAAVAALLGGPDPPTGIAASTDLAAVGVLHGAHRAGYLVPRDLSVVGFDDIPVAAYTVPALTTLRMPVSEMVSEAVGLVVALARDSSASRAPRVQLFKPSLILRDSTAAPSA